MALTLPQRPAQYFIDEILLPGWRPYEAHGFDIRLEDPADERFCPVATSIDNVGAVYPSLIVQYSNETSGGESTYDFMTSNGPGQNRTGELIVTARTQQRTTRAVATGGTYGGGAFGQTALGGATAVEQTVDADDLAVALIAAVESVVARNATGGTSRFQTLGSQRGPDVPDDYDEDPPVRLAGTQISYTWVRQP